MAKRVDFGRKVSRRKVKERRQRGNNVNKSERERKKNRV